MKTAQPKPLSANLAPETRQLLADKMTAYFRRFGGTRRQQISEYSNSKYGIPNISNCGTKSCPKKYSYSTLYKFTLQGVVSNNSTFDVLRFFELEYCKTTWELEGVIKHVENGEK